MSKAFVKESDADDAADLPEDGPALPAGVKNYMTPEGHRRLQQELQQLLREERPKTVEVVAWAAGNGDRSENGDYIYGKKRLREIDRRIRFLSRRLEAAEIVDPARRTRHDQVFFGATVTYADSGGAERTITIVGIDEADADRRQRLAGGQPRLRAEVGVDELLLVFPGGVGRSATGLARSDGRRHRQDRSCRHGRRCRQGRRHRRCRRCRRGRSCR